MKKYLILSAIIFIALPNVISAAWWNPFTWGKTETFQSTTTSQVEVVQEEQVSTTSPFSTSQTPTETVITKTITVDSPEQQKKINELTSNYNNLLNQYNSLIGKYNQCQLTPRVPTQTTPTLTPACQAVKNDIDSALLTAQNEEESWRTRYDLYSKKDWVESRRKTEMTRVETEGKAKVNEILRAVETLRLKFNSLCGEGGKLPQENCSTAEGSCA